jgi:hypothetical protein
MAIEQTADELIPELRRYQRPFMLAGAAGLAIAGLVSLFVRDGATQFFQSYLVGYLLCLGVTLGCLALGMVHQLSGGAWSCSGVRSCRAPSPGVLIVLSSRSAGESSLHRTRRRRGADEAIRQGAFT